MSVYYLLICGDLGYLFKGKLNVISLFFFDSSFLIGGRMGLKSCYATKRLVPFINFLVKVIKENPFAKDPTNGITCIVSFVKQRHLI